MATRTSSAGGSRGEPEEFFLPLQTRFRSRVLYLLLPQRGGVSRVFVSHGLSARCSPAAELVQPSRRRRACLVTRAEQAVHGGAGDVRQGEALHAKVCAESGELRPPRAPLLLSHPDAAVEPHPRVQGVPRAFPKVVRRHNLQVRRLEGVVHGGAHAPSAGEPAMAVLLGREQLQPTW